MEAAIVDLTPLTSALVQLLAAALLAVLTVGARWLFKVITLKTGMDIEDAQREKVYEALANAIEFARIRSTEFVAARDNIQVRDEVIALAAGYVVGKVPEALAYLDVDEEAVKELVEARLQSALD